MARYSEPIKRHREIMNKLIVYKLCHKGKFAATMAELTLLEKTIENAAVNDDCFPLVVQIIDRSFGLLSEMLTFERRVFDLSSITIMSAFVVAIIICSSNNQ